jgi:hypothetical protein
MLIYIELKTNKDFSIHLNVGQTYQILLCKKVIDSFFKVYYSHFKIV